MKKWSLLLAVWIAPIALSSFTIQQERVAGPAKGGTYFVAVNGNDSWSGRLRRANAKRTDGLFATLEAACKAARRLGTKQSRTVVVQGGRYFLDKPLVLTLSLIHI